jgi:seryl-tRNA synthetase
MNLSCCVPELLAYEIYNNLGEMHPMKQQMFEITSEIILIPLLV